ncbi:c-type cytochrome biogenesis protein CcmI [Microbaculum marinum]|uniref:C-type cytochrome biogenesis protein CcmI n=1 Tax=Microbaculum marinum TaxID=1764581 RepID=A0AAW9RMF1_9HYPH
MLLWVTFAVLTGIAVLAVLVPLSRARARQVSGRESDIAVYKDQLREVEADLKRGVINGAEAQAARIEVGRRLLAADRAARDTGPVRSLARPVAVAVIVLLPLFSLATYLLLGSPDLPGQPLSARLEAPTQGQDVNVLVARVEEHLAENPEDGQGWEVVAPVYMRLGRYREAAAAYANAVRLLGSTAEREADHGEALVVAGDGIVTSEAKAAFERALEHAPGYPKARFFLAIAAEQDGDTEGAVAKWRALLADTPPDAPWREAVTRRLAGLGEDVGDVAGAGDMPGPSAEEVAAAQAMSAEDRAQMIAGMVDGLAGRLAEDGRDLDGWLRLARAYVVLGEPDKARGALASARQNYPDDVAASERIDAAARALGLERS